jgi:hypothetical protein
MSDRSATASYKGYTFQRVYLLCKIFCTYYDKYVDNLDQAYFQEECLEDFDMHIITNDINKIYTYQLKYLSTIKTESLAQGSGLYKVLISHYNNIEIEEINYIVVCTNNIRKKAGILMLFEKILSDDIHNKLIGKMLCLYYSTELFNSLKEGTIDQNYEKIIETIQTNDVSLNLINKCEAKLKNFCLYCYNSTNIENLIKYFKKIKIDIIQKDFETIHNETMTKIKNLLPTFELFKNNMSESYNDFQTEILYGLFDSIIIKNLFKNNEKMSVKELITIVNNKFLKSETPNDKFQLFINSIAFFVKNNNINSFNITNKNEKIAGILLKNNCNISNFIPKFRDEIPASLNKRNIICKFIRQLIYDTCVITNYICTNDEKLINFINRTFKSLTFRGSNYPSLTNLDKHIDNFCLSQTI